ncbi:uncharacterized protein LOC144641134 [Oculina patagonica]
MTLFSVLKAFFSGIMFSGWYLALLSVWILCGFIISIRPASSIKCYVQTCVNHNCTSSKEIECRGTDDDSCGFLNYTVGSPRLKRTDTIATRNCTRWSKNDCNQPKVCERYRDSWVEPGYTFSACSVMCCNWDLCNKKGKGKNNRGGHKNGKGEAKEVKNIQDMLAKMSSIRI